MGKRESPGGEEEAADHWGALPYGTTLKVPGFRESANPVWSPPIVPSVTQIKGWGSFLSQQAATVRFIPQQAGFDGVHLLLHQQHRHGDGSHRPRR